MPKSIYMDIYKIIRERIESLEYEYQTLLPSEHTLVAEFDCSRNTIRRALGQLADEGYVQAIHGKGVRVIFQPGQHSHFQLGGIESFEEASYRNLKHQSTKVLLFSELTVDSRIAMKTGFEIGEDIYYIQRVRYIEDTPLIIDHNYFRKKIVPFLSKEIAEKSIYEYLENEIGITITTTKRVVTVEQITQKDEENLSLGSCNCVAVVSNSTYNSDGEMFEYTQSRHSPLHFEFHEVAQRNK